MALVERVNQGEQPVGRSVEMRGEFGDFMFQCGQVADRKLCDGSGLMVQVRVPCILVKILYKYTII